MAKKSITEVVGSIVDELTPLGSEDRRRVIHAALTLLGEGSTNSTKPSLVEDESGGEPDALPIRARTWVKQNGLSLEQIHQVYHLSNDEADVIASEIPGKINRDRVRNAYILLGIGRFLSTGEAKFDDKAARALCESSGIYDATNHTKFMKGGNEFTGTKEKGWTLTAPGLKRGAALIAELSKDS